MRVLLVACAMAALAAPALAVAPAAAAQADAIPVAAPATSEGSPPPAPASRVGLLPETWVDTLEANSISEQTALIAGGATVVAVGTGVAMAAVGATPGGIVGATLFTLWLAHIPIQMAVMGTGGYLAWNYLAPTEPAPAATTPR